MFNHLLHIEDKQVGRHCPVYIVAEIGINHNGDMDLARRTIDAARQAGVDAVKFQNYQTEDFLSDRSLTYRYVSNGKVVEESQYDMFKRCELSGDDLTMLAAYCRQVGISFHSTPTSPAGVRQLVQLGAPVLKNGSDYLVHLELIEEMGRTGLPVVLSTGMATLTEIEDAIAAFRRTGNEQLIVLHCTSRYPTLPVEVNLSRMNTLSQTFGTLVGFSDHSEGVTAAAIAAALGACWIEKHFTLSRELPGPDHMMSADPAELELLVTTIRAAEVMPGDPAIVPTHVEESSRLNFRLSCVAARDLAPGTIISREDIVFRRPGSGLPPKMADFLVGMELKKMVSRGQMLDKGSLQ